MRPDAPEPSSFSATRKFKMPANQQSGGDPAATARALLRYCQANDWAGHDPYDALNSKLLEALPFLDSRIPRLILTQALKRSPVSIRPLLRIPKTQNPKGLAIFLSATLKLARAGLLPEKECIEILAQTILSLRSPGTDHWCWGYSFPWQTRTLIVPRWSPNAVCTIFVAGALLDLYEETRDARYLNIGLSAAEFILGLVWSDEQGTVSLSYPLPTMRTPIHNANLLGAALLCRVARLSGEQKFLEPAFRLARYSAAKQHPDGSWAYGEASTQQWVDNFHTGYNLGALRSIGLDADTAEFEPQVRLGFEFYRQHFFREDGAPRYFHDRTYPIDGHCVAQSIITLLDLQDLDAGSAALARRVFDWSRANLWDERGFFYYRVLPLCRIRTSYMRWVQAWMLLALATLVESDSADGANGSPRRAESGRLFPAGRAALPESPRKVVAR